MDRWPVTHTHTSSTQGEVVVVKDILPHMMWNRYFLAIQGSKIEKSILYQDKKIRMFLEGIGRDSSLSQTKHINTRYFYIKDSVNSEEAKF